MPRHEALALLDEPTQEPGFRAPHVAAGRQGESARQLEGARELRPGAAELGEQLASAPAAGRGRKDAGRVRGLDHRGQRRIDVDRLPVELRLEQRPEPARLGDDVRRHDHDATRRARRVRLVGGERGRARARDQVLGAGERLVHTDVHKARARARQDDPPQQGQAGHERPRRDALGHARLGWNDEEQPVCQPDTSLSATPRPPARLDARAELSSATQSDASSRLAPRGAWPATSASNWSATASNQSGWYPPPDNAGGQSQRRVPSPARVTTSVSSWSSIVPPVPVTAAQLRRSSTAEILLTWAVACA